MDKLDSIVLVHEPILNNHGQLFILEQDSFRFDPFKKFAVFYYVAGSTEPKYMANFEVVTKSVFQVKKLTRMMSLMFFGTNPDEAIKKILRMKWKGRVGQESDFCMVCMHRTGYTPDLNKDNFENPKPKQ